MMAPKITKRTTTTVTEEFVEENDGCETPAPAPAANAPLASPKPVSGIGEVDDEADEEAGAKQLEGCARPRRGGVSQR